MLDFEIWIIFFGTKVQKYIFPKPPTVQYKMPSVYAVLDFRLVKLFVAKAALSGDGSGGGRRVSQVDTCFQWRAKE